jgi:molybdopterin-guanine dinucleotide biosynthesis protein A
VISGAVLCGGKSTRMGRDKAFVVIDGTPMARRVADALTAAGCAPVVAVGGDGDALARIGLDTIPDGWPGEGPVGGVITALRSSTADIVVVVACDTPWLDAATVTALLEVLVHHPSAVAAVARTDRVEPLCAVWRRSVLPMVEAAFDGGERRLHRVLSSMPTTMPVAMVPVPDDVLRNVNAPADVPRYGSPP